MKPLTLFIGGELLTNEGTDAVRGGCFFIQEVSLGVADVFSLREMRLKI